jgi:uncharacterized protein (TIGR03000 family)
VGVASALLLVGVGLCVSQAVGDRKIVVKLVLPDEEAKVTIDGKAFAGDGVRRDVRYTLAAGKKTIAVTTVWDPNNYTKMTRTRNVPIGNDDEVTVDLRQADPKNPDGIVIRFVPTPNDVIEEMRRMAKVGKSDVVYDLGCGDARMLIIAVKDFGAKRGVGIELDPKMVQESKRNVKKAGLEDRIAIRQGDVLKVADLSDASVVLLYMGEDINLRLRPILQKTLKPGSRVVSHRFTMGAWKPEARKTVDSSVGYPCDVILWVVKGVAKEKQ